MRAMPTGSLPCTWLLPAAASSRHACWRLAQTQSEMHRGASPFRRSCMFGWCFWGALSLMVCLTNSALRHRPC